MPKRVNFISIQQGHTVATVGYHQPILRTGYESIVPYRVGKMFAYMATKPGKVIKRNNLGIVIEYQDGERTAVKLGRIYGKAEGSNYPHEIVSPLNLNDVFEEGDTIAYNDGFFEPDFFNPKRLAMKNSIAVKTVIYEGNQTLEDSSVISEKISNSLATRTTKVGSYLVEFKQGVKEFKPVGTKVKPGDILFLIEDDVTENFGDFDASTLKSLERFSTYAPKSKVYGIIERYEVFYHGALEDMSNSLKAFAVASDKELKKRAESVDEPVYTGQVTDDYRVEGAPLLLDHAQIKVYITLLTRSGVGDKGVFGNQMKTVFGEVMDYGMTTEDGEAVDAIFGRRSIDARVVESPDIIGTTTTLVKLIGKNATDIYFGAST